MVVDSSALLAILRKEPEAARFTRAILRDSVRLISAANLLEAGIVIDNQVGLSAGRRLDAFVERAGIRIAPVTEAQVRIARQAYVDFGPRQSSGQALFRRLLCLRPGQGNGRAAAVQGDDFQHTDIQMAVAPER